ncbi:MAG: copper chaperone PCu(A)C [Sphingomonadaceae bacterium]|uniref:copper chaperone PCu(A)C n=1 Tax=Thermaurantiacus sp. TaxID=2820283 RepID=UPI00298ED684|nr:copper chaperone PCu(A)C [Thermaurantiacus sp.]MCS6986988.1 copper chaperone PCu(A)C [Sphingomonadaceae bacterium]MDW8415411.1 copper chaperone PCu(A)C [Thermaurantiacus sp.]
MSGRRGRVLGVVSLVAAGGLLALALFGGRVVDRPALAQAGAVRASEAWIRLPAAPGRPAAGYVELVGAAGEALVAASTPMAARTELHSMVLEGGVMRMRAEPRLPFDGDGRLVLKPGGHHLMFFDLDPKLKPGQRVPVDLVFASGAKLRLSAEARAPTGEAHRD